MSGSDSNPKDPIGSELFREDASFREIVEQFLQGLGERIRGMEQALRDANFDALRMAAHQLKGSGGGYGYPQLSHQASELERLALKRSLDECLSGVDDIKQLCSRLVVDSPDS